MTFFYKTQQMSNVSRANAWKFKLQRFFWLGAILIGTFGMASAQNSFDINASGAKNLQAQESDNPVVKKLFQEVDRYRQFSYNEQLIDIRSNNIGDILLLHFFDDKQYESVIQRVAINSEGRTSITSKIMDHEFAYCYMVVSETTITISAELPLEDEYFFASIKEGQAYTGQMRKSELNKTALPCTSAIPDLSHQKYQQHSLNSGGRGMNDPVTIDLLYVYTAAAEQWAAADWRVTDIHDLIDIATQTSNTIMENSGTGITFNIVYKHKTNYIETNTMEDLDRITDPNDGYMDEVHVLRDTYYADEIVFIPAVDFTGGVAWLLEDVNGFDPDYYAVALCRVQQSSWTYTVVHEVGHNMGCGHHADQNVQPGPGLFPYSSGWRGTTASPYNTLFSTVMTYEDGVYFSDGIYHPRIPYFSSPDIFFEGVPLGTSLADNVQTLKRTKNAVAGYRSKPATPTTLPYVQNFEDWAENSNWTLLNGTQNNRWDISSAVYKDGGHSLYISNTGTTHNYNISTTSYVYAYRPLHFEEQGNYHFSFDWLCVGETDYDGYDIMRAFLVPASISLSAGNAYGMTAGNNNVPNNWIAISPLLDKQSSWQSFETSIAVTNTGFYNLVFFWKNDSSYGSGIPGAVDNIQVTFEISGFCGGNGTETNPYQICDAASLAALADYVNAGNGDATEGVYFALTADIDLGGAYAAGEGWDPIGNSYNNYFLGKFNGNGFVVKNLTINRPWNNYIGLFGNVGSESNASTGTNIENVGIIDCNINGGGSTGALVGYHRTSSHISGCFATGSVSGTNTVGGLVAENFYNAEISNCYSTCSVNGTTGVGGLVGRNWYSATITNCYATGNVSASENNVGGLAGNNDESGIIKNCVAGNSSVTASEIPSSTNRIAGHNVGGIFLNNYALNTMSVQCNGTTVPIVPNLNDETGANATLATLKSFDFYSTSGNWNGGAWSIDEEPSTTAIWKICNGISLPFFQWQEEVECIEPFVDAETPVITTQPVGDTYNQNATANALTITVNPVSDGGTLSYQWYSNEANSTVGSTAVGTNSNSYTPPTTAIGTLYYYVVVTNTNNSVNGNTTVSVTSDIVAIKVNENITPSTGGIFYVNHTKNGDGSSWANAYPNLADPLLLAAKQRSGAIVVASTDTIREIYVAEGTYYPAYTADGYDFVNKIFPETDGGRDNAFVLVEGVKIYGGFVPTETPPIVGDGNVGPRTNNYDDPPNGIYVSPTGNDGTATGSITSPYKSINAALNAAPAGSTIILRSGTYYEYNNVRIQKPNTTIKSAKGEWAVIDLPLAHDPDAVWHQTSTIRFDVDGAGSSGSKLQAVEVIGGFYAVCLETKWDWGQPDRSGASNIIIEDCILHDSRNDVVKVKPGCDNITIRYNEIYNSGQEHITHPDFTKGERNAEGIDNVNGDNMHVHNNYIHDICSNGVYAKGGAIGAIIENNIVERTYGAGILLGFDTSSEFFSTDVNPLYYENIDGIVRNNLVIDAGWEGIGLYAAKDAQVYNNTVVSAVTYGTGHYHSPIYYGTPTQDWNNPDGCPPSVNPNIHHNIVSQPSTYNNRMIEIRYIQAGDVYDTPISGLDGNPTMNDNCYYVAGKSATFRDMRPPDANNLNLAAWKARINSDIGTIETNPTLDANYMPTNAQCEGMGLLYPLIISGEHAGSPVPLGERAGSPIPFGEPGRDGITILSGDIDKDGTLTDNCYHVVLGVDIADDGETVIDGVTISEGNASCTSGCPSIMVNHTMIPKVNGGGVCNSNSSPTLTHVTISGNSSEGGGGMVNNSSSPTLTNVIISGNLGGGMGNVNSSPTLTHVTISGNSGNMGGGMGNINSSPTLTNVTISGNFSSNMGGGMYNMSSSPTLTNVTISGNFSSNIGGGMYNGSGSPKVYNSIIFGNHAQYSNDNVYNDSGNSSEYSYSLIEGSGGSSSWDILFGTDGGYNIDADPLFVDPKAASSTPTTDGDYSLQMSSPAINAGDNDLYLTARDIEDFIGETDLAGNPRLYDEIIDMGAYEFQTAISFVPVTNITNVPTTATATLPLTLTGTVVPSNATNQTIVWSVQSAGTTGVNITGGNILNTTGTGTATILATIANGTSPTQDYTQTCTITVSLATLGGTVTVTGNTVFGQTLTAVTTGLTSTPTIPSLGTLSYQWQRGTSNITGATASTYTLVQADIGSTIRVLVTAANCTGTVTSGNTAIVTKATQTAPAAPTMLSNTSNSITLNTLSSGEYNINGGNYQSSPAFTGLTPSTSYNFTQRLAETATHLASPVSPSASFSTAPPEHIPVTNITNVPTTATATLPLTLTGTVVPNNATNQTIVWSVQSAGTTGANITGDNILNTTGAGTAIILATIVNGTSPTQNYTQTCTITVSLAALGGTVTVTGSPVFGQTLTAVTSALTSSPVILALGTLSYQWQRGTTNISGATSATYALQQADIDNTIRVVVSAANCSGDVTSTSTATVTKATQTAPLAPTMLSNTSTTITLNTVTGCEYNMNEGTWQTSPEFAGLEPNTSYSFTQRLAETATHLASAPSVAIEFSTQEDGITENIFNGVKVYNHKQTVYIINEGNVLLKGVEIMDMLGRIVYDGIVTDTETAITLQVPNAIYVVRLLSEENKTMHTKVSINK